MVVTTRNKRKTPKLKVAKAKTRARGIATSVAAIDAAKPTGGAAAAAKSDPVDLSSVLSSIPEKVGEEGVDVEAAVEARAKAESRTEVKAEAKAKLVADATAAAAEKSRP